MTRPATRPPFTFTIAPGRFSDDPTAARKREAKVVDAIIGTEATHWPFDVPGWRSTQGRGVEGESFVAIGPRFKFARSWAEPLTKGGGRNRFKNPTYAACLVAQDTLTGHMVGFIGVHLRAHNFKGSKRYRPENIVAWWQGFRGLRRARRKMNRYYPGIRIVMAGDPNATRRNYFARAVHKTFPNASIGWGGPFSSSLLWGLRVLSVRTVNPGAASDHPWKRLTVAYRSGVVAVGGGRRG